MHHPSCADLLQSVQALCQKIKIKLIIIMFFDFFLIYIKKKRLMCDMYAHCETQCSRTLSVLSVKAMKEVNLSRFLQIWTKCLNQMSTKTMYLPKNQDKYYVTVLSFTHFEKKKLSCSELVCEFGITQ